MQQQRELEPSPRKSYCIHLPGRDIQVRISYSSPKRSISATASNCRLTFERMNIPEELSSEEIANQRSPSTLNRVVYESHFKCTPRRRELINQSDKFYKQSIGEAKDNCVDAYEQFEEELRQQKIKKKRIIRLKNRQEEMSKQWTSNPRAINQHREYSKRELSEKEFSSYPILKHQTTPIRSIYLFEKDVEGRDISKQFSTNPKTQPKTKPKPKSRTKVKINLVSKPQPSGTMRRSLMKNIDCTHQKLRIYLYSEQKRKNYHINGKYLTPTPKRKGLSVVSSEFTSKNRSSTKKNIEKQKTSTYNPLSIKKLFPSKQAKAKMEKKIGQLNQQNRENEQSYLKNESIGREAKRLVRIKKKLDYNLRERVDQINRRQKVTSSERLSKKEHLKNDHELSPFLRI